MDNNTTLTAWHGWAFDRTCWDQWKQLLPGSVELDLFDRGYLGEANSVDSDAQYGTHIIFTHSFGLHLCPTKQINAADLVVIFCGFRTFHPVATQFRRRSKLVLNKMIQRLQEAPEAVLREFLKNTYNPEEAPELADGEFNNEKLLHDLQTLNQATLDMEPLKEVPEICILHGSADSIVPNTKGRELYNILQQKASYFEVKGAGHALPFTHTEQCWAFIQPVLDEIVNTTK